LGNAAVKQKPMAMGFQVSTANNHGRPLLIDPHGSSASPAVRQRCVTCVHLHVSVINRVSEKHARLSPGIKKCAWVPTTLFSCANITFNAIA
jgi:hypothetical protein